MAKILLITTGGTIACPDTDKARAPENSAKKFLDNLSGLSEINAEIAITEPFCLDSTNITPRHWLKVAEIIRENYAEFDGFVITHGTDTLAYAAAALSCFIANSEKPIALTGSMKPFFAENSDAPENLRNALLFAADTRSHVVSVVFGKFAYDGRRVSKIHSTARNAFESVNFPPTAAFDERGITFTEPIFSFSGKTVFNLAINENVEVLYLIPGMSPPIIKSETRAVIVLGFGTGGLPDYLEDFFADIIGRGIYAIMSTQVLRGGSKLSLYEVGSKIEREYPVIDAGKMTVEYAAMRAMTALSLSDNFEDFKVKFLYNN